MPVVSGSADEGRRVLRNVASFGAFLLAPLTTIAMSRAFGPAGFGRWWWTFGLLEAASIFGNFGVAVFIRAEVPRRVRTGGPEALPEVVGSGLAVVLVAGTLLALLQLALTLPLARSQGDPDLIPFLAILAVLPVLWNASAVFVAALQSIDVIGSVALAAGIVIPLIQICLLFAVWACGLPTELALLAMVLSSAIGVAIYMALYARHHRIRRTLALTVRPRHARAALRYGTALIGPSILFTAGGKLDVYVLRAHVDAAAVGVYAGGLTVAALLPAMRGLFDPIVQKQIGSLHGADDGELRASLSRMTRMCMLALVAPLAGLIAVGEPLLALLVGQRVEIAVVPLMILCAGQLVGSMAIAGWLIPMMTAGRVLALIAAMTLVVKLVLLLALVPHYGLIGAAIATAVGTVIAQQGQVLFAARRLNYRPYELRLLPPLVASVVVGIAGRIAYVALAARMSELAAMVVGGAITMALLAVVLAPLLDRGERAAVRRLLRLRPRSL